MSNVENLYCLDTSLLINSWNKRYPIDVLPWFWDFLDALLSGGQAKIPWEVYLEIKKQEDNLAQWVDERKSFISKPDETELEVIREVMAQFPNFAAEGGSLNAADPWVISTAIRYGAIVVTDETYATKGNRKSKAPKIPNACEKIGVKWMPPVELLRTASNSR